MSLPTQTYPTMETEVRSPGGSNPGSSRSSPESHVTTRKKETLNYLSAKKQSKLEKYDKRKAKINFSPSKILVTCKWLATFLMGGALLVCVTICKTSTIELVSIFMVDGQSAKSFVMILLLIMVPYTATFIRSAWRIFGRRDLPWPKRSSLILCIVMSALECLGTCCFLFVTLQTNFAAISLLLMDSVFILPTISVAFQYFQTNQTERSSRTTIGQVIGPISAVFGVAGTGYLLFKHIIDNSYQFIGLTAVGVICISASWMPWILKGMMKIKRPTITSSEANSSQENSFESAVSSSTSTYVSSGYMTSTERSASLKNSYGSMESNETSALHESFSESAKDINMVESLQNLHEYSENHSHWKTLTISSFTKCVLVIPFSLIINVIFPMIDIDEFPGGWDWVFDDQTTLFLVNISCSLIGYFLCVFACRTCSDIGGFAIPLILAPLLVYLPQLSQTSCEFSLTLGMSLQTNSFCQIPSDSLWLFLASAAALLIARASSLGILAFKRNRIVLEKETKLFYMATYSGVLPDQWMLVNRNTSDFLHEEYIKGPTKSSKIFICTTMFRENRTEMAQLLRSIWAVNIEHKRAEQRLDEENEGKGNIYGKRDFESHIFLDGAVRGGDMQDNALQLVSLLNECLGINHLDDCTKTITPYGLRLSWRLSIPNDNQKRGGMRFTIHMKDTKKVKNKKRWSQIMYMSYVLDFLHRQNVDSRGNILDKDEDLFILTTDADVKFKFTDVQALLDLMMRDPTVGAVCARTYPLGGGPLVWYQKFEYAIGHWFQKAAEHVLGSVLCAPGCFSVYRCSALRDIVPTYASDVERAFEFLIKDMGEDRWLCTLMVQSGWRIEYCAASTNETYCPEEFDEFFKQRRRWVASTLANIWKVINEWKYIRAFNHRVSYLFCIYQIFLFISTIVGPSTVIMVVSGGLAYAWGVDIVATVLLQIAVCVCYAIACVKLKQHYQMTAGKILTFVYALVMTAVAVGIAKTVAIDFATHEEIKLAENSTEEIKSTKSPQAISESFDYSVTTLYLGSLAAIFLATGIFHLKEVTILVYGLTYLLCLPSCYLILMIYCVCNITDRSWGTREEKTEDDPKGNARKTWHEQVGNVLRNIFFCCDKEQQETDNGQAVLPRSHRSDSSSSSSGCDHLKRQTSKQPMANVPEEDIETEIETSFSHQQPEGIEDEPEISETVDAAPLLEKEQPFDDSDYVEILTVDEWLDEEELRRKYSAKFKANGYENTIFISMLTDRTLRKIIGVDILAHRNHFLEKIDKLPQYKIEIDVPENVESWLVSIGLEKYRKNFKDIKIVSSKQLETLKSMKEHELRKDLKITKHGHLKRLMSAIEKMRYPTPEERRIIQIKDQLKNAYTHELSKVNKEEHKFWADIIKACLEPNSNAFGQLAELKKDLEKLRFNALIVAGIVNCLWLVLALTLAGSADLTTAGTNPLGLVFLIVFGFIFIIQFLCMLVHRMETLSHFVARLPYKFKSNYKPSGSSEQNDPDVDQALKEVSEAERTARKRQKEKQHKQRTLKRNQKLDQIPETENSPLLAAPEISA